MPRALSVFFFYHLLSNISLVEQEKEKIIILKRPFHPMKRSSIHMEIVILAPPLKSLSVVSPGQRRMEVANQNSHSSRSEAFSPQSLVRSQSWYCKKEWGIWSQEIWMWVCSTTSSPWRRDQITTSQDVSFCLWIGWWWDLHDTAVQTSSYEIYGAFHTDVKYYYLYYGLIHIMILNQS